jgi:hypothetical protein
LYWAEANPGTLMRLPLLAGATPSVVATQPGLFTDARLLTDEGGIHALASGLGRTVDDPAPPVNLLHFTYEGALTGMEPLGNRVVNQITQDGSAFYSGLTVDEMREDEGPFQRITSVVRIDKAMRRVTPLLGPETMTIPDPGHNGYLGTVSDGRDLFVVYEGPATAAGTSHWQIGHIVMASTATAGELTPIYDLEVPAERNLTTVRLLGAVDGAVIFARDEFRQPGLLLSSSVLVIPPGATSARFIADFARDLPVSGIGASDDQIFWMNRTGRIFALSREALAP